MIRNNWHLPTGNGTRYAFFTQFVIVESFITTLTDLFPKLLRAPGRHKIFVFNVCAFSFLVHLTLVTQVSPV